MWDPMVEVPLACELVGGGAGDGGGASPVRREGRSGNGYSRSCVKFSNCAGGYSVIGWNHPGFGDSTVSVG